MEIPVWEIIGAIRSAKPGTAVKTGAAIKGGKAFEYEVSPGVERERPFKSGVRRRSEEISSIWAGTAIFEIAVNVVAGRWLKEDLTGRRLVEEVTGWGFERELAGGLTSVRGHEEPTVRWRLIE